MIQRTKILGIALVLLPGVVLAQANSSAATSAVIYKHVDEQGRVTYANSPIKGGVRVELEPLTIIPSTPTGSLRNPSASVTAAPVPVPVANVVPVKPSPASAAVPAPIRVASVMPLSSAMRVQPTSLPAPQKDSGAAANDAVNQLTLQRRDEARNSLLESELQSGEQMLAAARARLAEEQKQSASIRAMRARFSNTAEAATAQKPLIAPELRAEIERHFERVRNLQDQVAMHENQLQGLREKLASAR
ncbi:MAG: DUF4124 domain-containing protein [Burkholderiales bacterium]|nr:DUF4124 domain-containing protein [Burkholderiales bacterium]